MTTSLFISNKHRFTICVSFILILSMSSDIINSSQSEKLNNIYGAQTDVFEDTSKKYMGFQEGSIFGSNFAAGKNHFCKINHDEILCEGDNIYGQLGKFGDQNLKNNTFSFPEFGNPLFISSGYNHSCSISDRSLLICWGSDDFGQSSGHYHNKNNNDYYSINIHNKPIVSVSTGMQHTCAITADNSVWCWGLSLIHI